MKNALALLAIAATLAAPFALAQSNVTTLFQQTPGAMKFVPDLAHPGLSSAVLVGDPTRAGIYAVHTRLCANLKLAPHSHSEIWRIATVVSGTLYYSAGAGQFAGRTPGQGAFRDDQGRGSAAAHRRRGARGNCRGPQIVKVAAI